MPTLNAPASVPKDLRDELEEAFGFLPSFALATTPDALRLWWAGVRDFQLSDKTALDGKTKELIGLAVAAQVPCGYCARFHTEAARLHGATEREIQEAVFMAGLTRQGSALLNGAQLDEERFAREMDDIVLHLKAQARHA